jgi:hypothetical protein
MPAWLTIAANHVSKAQSVAHVAVPHKHTLSCWTLSNDNGSLDFLMFSVAQELAQTGVHNENTPGRALTLGLMDAVCCVV